MIVAAKAAGYGGFCILYSYALRHRSSPRPIEKMIFLVYQIISHKKILYPFFINTFIHK